MQRGSRAGAGLDWAGLTAYASTARHDTTWHDMTRDVCLTDLTGTAGFCNVTPVHALCMYMYVSVSIYMPASHQPAATCFRHAATPLLVPCIRSATPLAIDRPGRDAMRSPAAVSETGLSWDGGVMRRQWSWVGRASRAEGQSEGCCFWWWVHKTWREEDSVECGKRGCGSRRCDPLLCAEGRPASASFPPPSYVQRTLQRLLRRLGSERAKR
jgi:hypothetical protein